jgi:hypothetical protein
MFRNIQVQFEPIDQWPGKRTSNRKRGPFRASLQDTYRLLEKELSHLGCRRLVIQADCDRRMIRNDGLLRSDARLNGPGVILSFDSKHGPLNYPCDTFQHWDDNLRAIALALEALRAVDRYGVTKRAEQYRGWQQLPAPNGDSWTWGDAHRFVRSIVGDSWNMTNRDGLESALRFAEKRTHPDAGGNAAEFKKVQRARELLLK